jgi:nicotinate-nucleotide adenylyltransferase
MLENTDMDKVCFVVSPQNPFKTKSSLLEEIHRYAIVQRAIEDDQRFEVSNIEFSMPKPSYTSDTLVRLSEKYPDKEFVLILGQDNLKSLHKWKNIDYIIDEHELYVYPRAGAQATSWDTHKKVHLLEAPQVEISASFIRNSLKKGHDVRWMLPVKGWKYMMEMSFYK